MLPFFGVSVPAQGTSLQITPACNLPLKNLNARRKGGKGSLAIVNLQASARMRSCVVLCLV